MFKIAFSNCHRRKWTTGPMFKLGDRIVQKCKLEAAVYTSEPKNARRTCTDTAPVQPPAKHPRNRQPSSPSDVEPDSTDSERETRDDAAQATVYQRKKEMSSMIFRYFVHADFDKQRDMQVDVSDTLQKHWK